MKQQDPKFEVVPLSDVPRENAADAPKPALMQEKNEPYATDVVAGRKDPAALFCYCRNCELRFPLVGAPQLGQDYVRDLWLRCPYCGHLDQYTLADLLRASEESIGGVSKLVQ